MSKAPGKRQSSPFISEIYEPQPAPKPSKLGLSLKLTESGSFSPGKHESTYDNSTEIADLLERALGLSTDRKQERTEAPTWGEAGHISAFTIQPASTLHTKTHSASQVSVTAHSQPASPSALVHEQQRNRFLTSRLSELNQRYQHLQQAYETLSSGSADGQYKGMYEELVQSGKREKETLVRRVKALEEEISRVRNKPAIPVQKPSVSSQVLTLASRLSSLELRLSSLEKAA